MWQLQAKLAVAEALWQLTGSRYWWERKKGLSKLKAHILRERARVTRALWFRVQFKQYWTCQMCHITNYMNRDYTKPKMEVDHRQALAVWGTSDESNLQVLCSPCNRAKGVKLI